LHADFRNLLTNANQFFQTDALGLKQLWLRHRDLQKTQYQTRLINLYSYGLIVLLHTLRRFANLLLYFVSFENFSNNHHASPNRICGLLNTLVSHRLPDTSGFVPTVVMRSVISEDGDGRKLIVLDILERCSHLKQKFRHCLTVHGKHSTIAGFRLMLSTLEELTIINDKKQCRIVFQTELPAIRNVVVPLPVMWTDVVGWTDQFVPTRDPRHAKGRS